MGSGKSTLALQIHHNLSRHHKVGALLSQLDRAGAKVSSRLGVSSEAVQVTPDLNVHSFARQLMARSGRLDYLVCDEAQFYTVEQADQLSQVVDDFGADVYAFGLITDFRGMLFDGTRRLLEVADERVQLHVEARCWCGERATNNARIVNGEVVYTGDVVVVGDTDKPADLALFGDVVTYELLCRRHYKVGLTETTRPNPPDRGAA
jgi:thymidine kinase